jgi:hypothetical protein
MSRSVLIETQAVLLNRAVNRSLVMAERVMNHLHGYCGLERSRLVQFKIRPCAAEDMPAAPILPWTSFLLGVPT